MSGYTAWVNIQRFIRLNDNEDDGNLVALSADANVSGAPEDYQVKLERTPQETRNFVVVWKDPSKTEIQPMPWEGTLAELRAKVWYVEGVWPSGEVDDIHFEIRLWSKAGGPLLAFGERFVTVVKPKIDVFSNIRSEWPGASDEWQLQNETILPEDYVTTMAGVRVRMKLNVEPAGAMSYVDLPTVIWYPGSGLFYPDYHVDSSAITGAGQLEVFWSENVWENDNPPALPHVAEGKAVFRMGGVGGTVMEKIIELHSRVIDGSVVIGDDVKMLQELSNYLGFRTLAASGKWWKLVGEEGSRPRVDLTVGSDTGAAVIRFRKQNFGTWTSQASVVDSREIRNYRRHHDDYRIARNSMGWNNGSPTQPGNSRISAQDDDTLQIRGWIETAAPVLTYLHQGLVFNPTFMGNPVTPLNPTNKELYLVAIMDIESSYTHWGRVADMDPPIPWQIRFSRTNSTDIGALGFIQMMPFNSERYNAVGSIGPTIELYDPLGNLKAGAEYMNDHPLKDVMTFGAEWYAGNDTLNDLVGKAGFMYNGGSPIITNGFPTNDPRYEYVRILQQFSWNNVQANKGQDPWGAPGMEVALWSKKQESVNYGNLLMQRLGIA